MGLTGTPSDSIHIYCLRCRKDVRSFQVEQSVEECQFRVIWRCHGDEGVEKVDVYRMLLGRPGQPITLRIGTPLNPAHTRTATRRIEV